MKKVLQKLFGMSDDPVPLKCYGAFTAKSKRMNGFAPTPILRTVRCVSVSITMISFVSGKEA